MSVTFNDNERASEALDFPPDNPEYERSDKPRDTGIWGSILVAVFPAGYIVVLAVLTELYRAGWLH